MSDKNPFGGGNARSLYVPMSDLEQEAISRLVAAQDLKVVIVGWGVVERPRVIFGDARIGIRFNLEFNRPEAPMPVHHFDLELRTGSGMLLFRDRQPTEYDGKPIFVAAGVQLEMVWDIAIQHLDPALVKSLVPSAVGLTSRVLDRDTGTATVAGNMQLSPKHRDMLERLRRGEAAARQMTRKRLHDPTDG